MKRTLSILVLGIVLALAGYCAYYYKATAPQRGMLHSDAPELAWLKQEFKLDDAEFKRISDLHDSYMPKCDEMCEKISAKKAEIRVLISSTNVITPEIEKKLSEAAELRASCQKMMLDHFFAVSRAMPPEQGKRYLAWVQDKTLMENGGSMNETNSAHHHE